jgi:hypothetical protein
MALKYIKSAHSFGGEVGGLGCNAAVVPEKETLEDGVGDSPHLCFIVAALRGPVTPRRWRQEITN